MKNQFWKMSLLVWMSICVMTCKQADIEKKTQNSTQNVIKDENVLPKTDEFVAYEKDPYFDVSELSKNLHYPKYAADNQIEGKVRISVLIDKFGKVKKVIVRESTSTIFNDAAIDAVNNTKFNAGILKGNPVDSWIMIPIVFKLKE